MTVSLDSFQLAVSYNLAWSNPRTDIANLTFGANGASAFSLTDGTGAANVGRLVHCYRHTIAASTRLSLNLKSGATGTDIENPDGDALTYTIIRAVFIHLRTDTAAATLTIGGGTNGSGLNAWTGGCFIDATDKIRIGNGAAFTAARYDATGYTVAAGNVLALYNDDASLSAKVDVVIIGE